ncbi:MAG TPA: hypothetical protein PK252_07765 [Bacteroidales bacterium]|nr:hypothetical protein [Bacteroidales bacterium]
MKKALIIVGSIIGLLVLVVVIYLAVMGMFSSPKVTEKEMGPYCFVYEDFTGPYQNTGPVFDKVYKAMTDAGIKSTLGIGVYFDNPAEVPAEKLRSQCGAIYDIADSAKVAKLLPTYKLGKIEKKTFVVVEFPIKGAMSYMIGPAKCYPVLDKYFTEKGMKAAESFEIYDMPNKVTYYIMAGR